MEGEKNSLLVIVIRGVGGLLDSVSSIGEVWTFVGMTHYFTLCNAINNFTC